MLKIVKNKTLDSNVLENLQQLGGPDDEKPFLDEMIDTFMAHTPQLIAELKTALEKNDVRAIEHFSHKLKGFGRNLGAVTLSQICDVIETNCASIDKAEVPYLVVDLENSYQEAVNALVKDWRTAA